VKGSQRRKIQALGMVLFGKSSSSSFMMLHHHHNVGLMVVVRRNHTWKVKNIHVQSQTERRCTQTQL